MLLKEKWPCQRFISSSFRRFLTTGTLQLDGRYVCKYQNHNVDSLTETLVILTKRYLLFVVISQHWVYLLFWATQYLSPTPPIDWFLFSLSSWKGWLVFSNRHGHFDRVLTYVSILTSSGPKCTTCSWVLSPPILFYCFNFPAPRRKGFRGNTDRVQII